MYTLWLQAEATLLKNMKSGGVGTKIVALGIGDGVDENELRDMASSPQDRNVILVQDFSDLTSVEERLRNEACNQGRNPVYNESVVWQVS